MDIEVLTSFARHLDWAQEKSAVAMGFAYDEGITISDDWLIVETAVFIASQFAQVVICEVIGHDFEDRTGMDAAESGAFDYGCNRCGWGASGYMTG